jgi:WD40 repeat protein
MLLLGVAHWNAQAESVQFSKEIAPILANKCQVCHSPEKSKGGYRLHTFEALMQPGKSKSPVIVPGDPKGSHLYQLITATDEDDRMPQKDDPLSREQIALIQRWIQEGAHFDGPDPKALLTSLLPSEFPQPPGTYSRPSPVLALAFHPNGSEIAVNGYHEVTIWNPTTGELLRRLKPLPERVQCLAYNEDGTLIAVGGGEPGRSGEVVLMEASGNNRRVLGRTSDLFLDLCFHPKAPKLIACGADNAIRIYDLASGKQERSIEQHADWVTSIAFNTNGTRLASASRDKTARVYTYDTGDLEATYAEDNGVPISSVVFVNDQTAASAGKDRKIHFWEVAEAKKAGEIGGFDQEIFRLVHDGDMLFCAGADSSVRQYHLPDRKLVREYKGHRDWVYALAVNSTTKRLASGSYDGEVRIWNTDNGELITSFVAAPGYLAAKK